MASNYTLTHYKGAFYPQFTTTDWMLIDECFEAQYNFYKNTGIIPPTVQVYAAGEVIPKENKEVHVTSMSAPAKRSHEEVETFYDPDGGKDAPPLKVRKLKEVTKKYNFHRTFYNDEDEDAVFDADEDYDDDRESECSDTTDMLVELAMAGRLDELYPLDDESDEIVSVAPKYPKPSFDFSSIETSSVAALMPDFLAEMKAANGELEAEMAAGTAASRVLEIDAEDDSEGGPYIEMNIGLGVLEEKKDQDDTSSESDNGTDTDEDVMGKLMGGGAKTENAGDEKKAKIEEL